MHPHLHTKDNTGKSKPSSPASLQLTSPPACAEVMAALDECHARGFLFRCIGGCNDAKHAVNKCLRGERLERTRLNREKSKAKNAEMRASFREIDANT
ncbi:UPF0287-domain-containing protein [Aulographum hederae CBS 113979]|uniref:COX assembly mitochondrial protein n=1 Tax=Aulographum hederae CBS 113979 TaxID=1176131 RepID=A0A6G1H8R8_9PEZI|nr:UPF0287-domain-containing protein [Aulographum hederae CBS 113979]